jgi:lipoate-protein ligase A
VLFRQDAPADGIENMSADFKMFERASNGESSARLYSWDSVWITLGRNQHPDETLLDPRRWRWVHRPTGGGAVMHGHDLTFAIAAPLEAASPGRVRVRERYMVLVEPIRRAMAQCGMATEFGRKLGVRDTLILGDCFGTVSASDLLDVRSGIKVCGCAMLSSRTACLIQGSIPVSAPLARPETVFVDGSAHPLIRWDWRSFGEALNAELAVVESV